MIYWTITDKEIQIRIGELFTCMTYKYGKWTETAGKGDIKTLILARMFSVIVSSVLCRQVIDTPAIQKVDDGIEVLHYLSNWFNR